MSIQRKIYDVNILDICFLIWKQPNIVWWRTFWRISHWASDKALFYGQNPSRPSQTSDNTNGAPRSPTSSKTQPK